MNNQQNNIDQSRTETEESVEVVREVFLAEYSSLREEILQRVSHQTTISEITITAWGLILVYALKEHKPGVDIKNSVKEVNETMKDVNEANANLEKGNTKMEEAISKIDSLQNTIQMVRDSVKGAQLISSKALSEINTTRDLVLLRNDSLERAIKTMKRNAENTVTSLRNSTYDALRNVSKTLNEIRQAKDTADIYVFAIKSSATKNLTPNQEEALKEEKELNPEKFRATSNNASSLAGILWKNGAVIKIFFLDGSQAQIRKVKSIANEWTKYANLKFEYILESGNSDVRITFKSPGNWSYLGTSCLGVAKTSPTICLSSVTNTPEIEDFDRHIILREFGFTLGFQSETNNRNCQYKWNVVKLKELYKDEQTVRRFFVQNWQYPINKACDLESVMMASIPSEVTTDGKGIGINTNLSKADKDFVAKLYPY